MIVRPAYCGLDTTLITKHAVFINLQCDYLLFLSHLATVYPKMSKHSAFVKNDNEEASSIDQDELQLVIEIQSTGTGKDLAGDEAA